MRNNETPIFAQISARFPDLENPTGLPAVEEPLSGPSDRPQDAWWHAPDGSMWLVDGAVFGQDAEFETVTVALGDGHGEMLGIIAEDES